MKKRMKKVVVMFLLITLLSIQASLVFATEGLPQVGIHISDGSKDYSHYAFATYDRRGIPTDPDAYIGYF